MVGKKVSEKIYNLNDDVIDYINNNRDEIIKRISKKTEARFIQFMLPRTFGLKADFLALGYDRERYEFYIIAY